MIRKAKPLNILNVVSDLLFGVERPMCNSVADQQRAAGVVR
jgi:hypothetical protein